MSKTNSKPNFSYTDSQCSQSTLSFLRRNPSVSDLLLADCNYDLDEVSTVIAPVFRAQQRCQFASCYIQAVTTGRTTFLATNLIQEQATDITPIDSCWSIGRSSTCAIPILDRSVSRCHAVIGYGPSDGFYITDVGSSNGTWVNHRRLSASQRFPLKDGDLLRLGTINIEFFATQRSSCIGNRDDITYH